MLGQLEIIREDADSAPRSEFVARERTRLPQHVNGIPPLRRLSLVGTYLEPLYIASAGRKLFGWLHTSSENRSSDLGLVICKPFGFEAMSGHLSVRSFADTAASLGIPTLRFDYAGTGDSEDCDPSIDQIHAWVADILAAVAELKQRTNVQRVCLLGFRLGALLASLAAERSGAIDALITIAPVLSGARYLRELRTFERAAAGFGAARGHGPAAAAGAGNGGQPPEPRAAATDGSMEVSGFLLAAATISTLARVDLAQLQVPVANLLVIDRNDQPVAQPWAETMAAAGVKTRHVILPGLVKMMLTTPNATIIPQEMLQATREWLADLPQSFTDVKVATDEVNSPAGGVDASPTMQFRSTHGEILSEYPVFLAASPMLFGIVTETRANENRRRGVILLNSGADLHIGPRRLNVSLARRWPANGYVVLRMDLAGLGDSEARPGRPGNEVFPPSAIEDIKAAVDFMRNICGVRELTISGMCSGAYHALRAAVGGLDVDRILLVNPLNFFWEEGMNDAEVQPWEVVRSASLSRAMSRESWKRLFSGDVTALRVASLYINRMGLELSSKWRNLARRLKLPLHNDLGRELRDLTDRGVRTVFVFSRGDAGVGLLQIESGLSEKVLTENYGMRMIDGADHDFTRSASRAALQDVLSSELFSTPMQPRINKRKSLDAFAQ